MMKLLATGLLSAAAFTLTAFAGPAPRDITTNKPSPEQCAAAAREGRNLLGCTQPGAMIPASSTAGSIRRPQPPANPPREPR